MPKTQPLASRLVQRLMTPVEKFLQQDSSAGVVLLVATAVAMIWANSAWAPLYKALVNTPIALTVGPFALEKTLHHWVNDGLMVIFFFVIGLEIKREMILGELCQPRKAALPLFAALGGMVLPALIYSLFNFGEVGEAGWGIPMATDIAFAIGLLSLVSRKVPFSLKVFLLALAIADDLGAILVIAIFYTSEVSQQHLFLAAVSFLLTWFTRYVGIKNLVVYTLLGVISWYAVLQSGVHATVAGVLLGLMTPVEPLLDLDDFSQRFQEATQQVTSKMIHPLNGKEHLDQIHRLVMAAKSPLDRLLHLLHPWVTYFIMPIFALVNAGVPLKGLALGELFQHPIALGVILGLFIGKPLGILSFSWIAIRMGWASLPQGVNWFHMSAIGWFAGIGFTMALFISHLAISSPAELETYSKLGVLIASTAAALLGLALMSRAEDAVDRSPSSD